MKQFLKWLVYTKLGWCVISFIWMAIFLLIDSNVDAEWPFWVAMLGAAYLFGLTLVMIAFAWVINPIREYKENKKLREELKQKEKNKIV